MSESGANYSSTVHGRYQPGGALAADIQHTVVYALLGHLVDSCAPPTPEFNHGDDFNLYNLAICAPMPIWASFWVPGYVWNPVWMSPVLGRKQIQDWRVGVPRCLTQWLWEYIKRGHIPSSWPPSMFRTTTNASIVPTDNSPLRNNPSAQPIPAYPLFSFSP